MAQNALKTVCDEAIAAMERIKKCNDSEVEVELKRSEGIAKQGEIVLGASKVYAAIYMNTGTLPADNTLFGAGEQIVTGGFLAKEKKPKQKGLLMDEFNRP